MGDPLQQRRAPQELAASGQVIEINNKITNFERLAEIVEADLSALDPDKLPPDWRDATVAGQLSFGFAAAQGNVPAVAGHNVPAVAGHNVPAVEGHVAVTTDAVCQRCLRPFVLPLKAELRLFFGKEQTAGEGYDDYEVWELDGDDVCPADLIEEALIMALPFVAMHVGDADCSPIVVADEKAVKMTLPFVNLKTQLDSEN